MIDCIILKNFKAYPKLDLKLRRFTLLAGLNGAGKSTVIQSLLLLRQSHLSGELERGQLSLNGGLAHIGTPQDLLFADAENDEVVIAIRIGEAKFEFSFVVELNEAADDYRLYPIQRNQKVARLMRESPANKLFDDGGMFQYLCAERYGPRTSLPMSHSNAAFDLGRHGEFTWHFLARQGTSLLLRPKDKRFAQGTPERLIDQVDYWLQEISPGSHLELESVRAADLMLAGFSFDRPKDVRTRAFRATNVGFGLSYVLPVLTALLAAPRGSLVIIENPEAHMHPRGQTRLGQLCARAAADGVQVIVETHSEHIMDGARIDVRAGLLDPDDAAFHYFERHQGIVQVKSPIIDKEGRLSEWPDGFLDQHRSNTAALIRPRAR